MSGGVTRRTLDQAGGAQLAGGQGWFKVDGQPVVLLGDPVEPHGPAAHGAPVMVEASAWLRLDGVRVCRAGNAASCGHATTGAPWFVIP